MTKASAAAVSSLHRRVCSCRYGSPSMAGTGSSRKGRSSAARSTTWTSNPACSRARAANQVPIAPPIRSGRVLETMTLRRGTGGSFGDGERGDEVVCEGTDGDGVEQRAGADGAAEQPTGGEYRQFDRGTHHADRVAAGGEAGHDAVTRTGAEPGADVQAGRHGVQRDRGDEQR